MKKLFTTFKEMLYAPERYRNMSEVSMKSIFSYYVKFGAFIALVMVVGFSAMLAPRGLEFVSKEIPKLVQEYYPHDLIVTVEKGTLSINQPTPYIIPMKEDLLRTFKEPRFKNLVVIDPVQDFDKKRFEEYRTPLLLTAHEIVTNDSRGSINIDTIPAKTTVVVDEAKILSWAEKIRSSFIYIVLGAMVVGLVMFTLGFVLYLIPLLLFALAPYAIARFKNMKLTYGDAYKMSMYAIVPGLTLKALLNVLGIFFVPYYLVFLIFLLIIVINLREVEQPTLFENVQ